MTLLPSDHELHTIYKYRSLSEYTFENLEKGQLRFSQPSTFNDPFDCMINIDYKGGRAEWAKYLNNLDEVKSKIKSILEYLRDKNYNADEHSIKARQMDELSVLSLTENCDSVLMWSHYAEYHKGICLGFETAIEGNSLGMLFNKDDVLYRFPGVTHGFLPMIRVEYQEDMPPTYKRLQENTVRIMEFAFIKHPDWDYEQERRVCGTKSMLSTQNVRYRKSTLKEVVFGYRASVNTIERVENILEDNFPDHGSQIKRRVAVPIDGKYAVRIIDL